MPEVTWQPSALAPVFQGVREYGPAQGAPCPMLVYFPSLDGSPQHADIFDARGPYPLVVFAHGQCGADGADHFRRWRLLPSYLARAGYVVAVPQLVHVDNPQNNETDLARLSSTVRWMRSRWEFRTRLAAPPSTGLVGHSFGAVLAGRLAAASVEPPVNHPGARSVVRRFAQRAALGRSPRLPRFPTRPGIERVQVGAYVSLGGDWHSAFDVAESLVRAHPPKCFIRGTDTISEAGSDLGGVFDRLRRPRHSAEFDGMEHFDYLLRGAESSGCSGVEGACRDYTFVVWDLVTMFLGRYLSSPAARDVPARIGPSLIPPALDLTRDQEFFAGNYLSGFSRLAVASEECGVTLRFDTGSQAGTVTRRGGMRRRPEQRDTRSAAPSRGKLVP